MKTVFSALVFCLYCLGSTVSSAQGIIISPGIDLFTTPGGGTSFAEIPLPPNFFDPGSDPFLGKIVFVGAPVTLITGPSVDTTDTIVERLDAVNLPAIGSSGMTRVIIRALHLRSVNPITVTYAGGSPEKWNVEVCLSATTRQDTGKMTIYRDCLEGGTTQSILSVTPQFDFERIGNPKTIKLDLPILKLGFEVSRKKGHWVQQPNPDFNLIEVPPGVVVDGNCNGIQDAEEQPLPGSTHLFHPGIWVVNCHPNCPPPPSQPPVQFKRLTVEESLLASHGILPAQQASPDADGDGIPDDADNCPNIANPQQEDGDSDGIGNLCDNDPTCFNPFQTGCEDSCMVVFSSEISALQKDLVLEQNHPNPFYGQTRIRYKLPAAGEVELSVLDALGRRVKTLTEKRQEAGWHEALWNGMDHDGNAAPSLFLQVEMGAFFSEQGDVSEIIRGRNLERKHVACLFRNTIKMPHEE